jgi:hypothetical protein
MIHRNGSRVNEAGTVGCGAAASPSAEGEREPRALEVRADAQLVAGGTKRSKGRSQRLVAAIVDQERRPEGKAADAGRFEATGRDGGSNARIPELAQVRLTWTLRDLWARGAAWTRALVHGALTYAKQIGFRIGRGMWTREDVQSVFVLSAKPREGPIPAGSLCPDGVLERADVLVGGQERRRQNRSARVQTIEDAFVMTRLRAQPLSVGST